MPTKIVLEIEEPEMVLSEEVIEEIAKQIIPNKLKVFLSSKQNRQILREKYGDKAFLLPDELKFPVMDGKGKYQCSLIYAARARAKQWAGKKPQYAEVAKKAEELYKKNKCNTKIHIKLHDQEEEVEFFDFLDILS